MGRIYSVLTLLLFLMSIHGCSGSAGYYSTGDRDQNREISRLLSTLEKGDNSYESRFIIIQQIIKVLLSAGEEEKLNLFLTTYIQKNTDDPFAAYYLLTVALNYKEEGAYPFAVHYFERILRNYQDLLVRGVSVHYTCLKNLITMTQNPEVRVDYYRALIGRFGDIIDRGPAFYYMAKTYEELGEWDLAIQAYKSYLASANTSIPGVPDAEQEIREKIVFYDRRDKNWTYESLDELVSGIKSALWSKDARRLIRYRAKVNFFAVSWEEEQTEADIEFLADIGSFMWNKIYYSDALDSDSNNREAYLRTWGWSYRITTWYLYFRKVNFPADPEIHGEWEWAGIYFGDKPFTGSASAQARNGSN